MNAEIKAMKRSKLFEGLEAEECKILYSVLKGTTEKLEKGQALIRENEEMEFSGIVSVGRLVGIKLDYVGNTHLMQIIEEGDLFGLEITATKTKISPMTIISEEPSSILKFSQDILSIGGEISLELQTKVFSNWIKILANDNIKKIYKMDMLASKSLRGRIATHLYLMKSKFGKSTFSIRMNREQFAQYLCVNRSALSHELSLMQKEGLLSFEKDEFTLYF